MRGGTLLSSSRLDARLFRHEEATSQLPVTLRRDSTSREAIITLYIIIILYFIDRYENPWKISGSLYTKNENSTAGLSLIVG